MKNVKQMLLAATIIASMGLATAYAATDDTTNSHRMRDLAKSQQTEQQEKAFPSRAGHGPQMGKNDVRMKLLAQVMGQDEKTVAKACFDQKLMPGQYADKNGKYAEYKAKRLEYAKTRLDKAVANGKITQAKADEAMNRITNNLELERKGQRPTPRFVKDLAIIVNKDETTVAKELREQKLTPAQYADKHGKYAEYKKTRLTMAKKHLTQGVADGKLTQDKADQAMKTIEKNLELERQGKRPAGPRPGFGPMHPGPQVPPDQMK